MSLLLISPVASGKGVAKTICDGLCLDSKFQVEVLREREWGGGRGREGSNRDLKHDKISNTLRLSINRCAYSRTSLVKLRNSLDTRKKRNSLFKTYTQYNIQSVCKQSIVPLCIWLSVNTHSPTKQEGQQGSSKVQSLVTIVVPVIKLPPPQSRLKEPVHHVAEEVGLPGLTEAADSNMRKEFLLEDVFCILDPLLPRHSGLGSTNTNEVECYILLLNNKGLVQ